MSTNTPNYGLIKPDQADFYNVDDFNANADTLDTAVKAVADKAANAVPNTRRVNGKQLNADITLDAADVGAEPAIMPSGSSAHYWNGLKGWSDLMSNVRYTVLSGLSTATNAAVTATDTVLSGFGKLQAQVNSILTNFEAMVRITSLAGLSIASSVAISASDSVLTALGKLQAQMNTKAPLSSPVFTGTPTAPTAAVGTNSTQIATMAAIYNSMVRQDVTYYLSPGGNDNNAGTSAGSAWRTWGKAFSSIPKGLNGYNCTLNVAGGTYNESAYLLLANIVGGQLNININGNVYINGTFIDFGFQNCSNVILNLNTYELRVSDGSFIVTYNSSLLVNGSTGSVININNGNVLNNGLYASRNSQITFMNSATILRIHNYVNAINAIFSVIRLVGRVEGTGNTYAFNAGGGLIQGPVASTHSISATQQYATSNGGRILFGAQTSIPNY